MARGEPALPLRVDLSSGGLETGAAIVARLRREAPGVVIEQAEHGVPRGLGCSHRAGSTSSSASASAGERPDPGELADALRLGAVAGAALPLIGAAVTWIGLAPRRVRSG